MNIAVDTQFLNTASGFTAGFLQSFAERHPSHRFIFISDKPFAEKTGFASNTSIIVTSPEIKNNLLLQYWYNYKLPALLKKQQADVFVGLQGACSLRTKIPQCLVIDDTSFIGEPSFFLRPHARYYKKQMGAWLAKVKWVGVFSESTISMLADAFKMDAAKAVLLNASVGNNFVALDENEKERVKEKYAAGMEYFLTHSCNNPRSNTLTLLKAFSFFKKRQKSNMLLLVSGQPQPEIIQALKTYKFRSAVVLLPATDATETAKITAAAYAIIHPFLYEDTGQAVLQAMQCRVPLLCSALGALPAICGDAALYFNPNGFEDIAEKMMLVYKDEDKAKQLVNTGAEIVARYQKDNTQEMLWSLIKKTVND